MKSTIKARYIPKNINPSDVHLLAALNRSPFGRRIFNADITNGATTPTVMLPTKILVAENAASFSACYVPDMKVVSVSINTAPTIILPLTCSNVLSLMISEASTLCPSLAFEPKICKLPSDLLIEHLMECTREYLKNNRQHDCAR
jgi:hypothetical protein